MQQQPIGDSAPRFSWDEAKRRERYEHRRRARRRAQVERAEQIRRDAAEMAARRAAAPQGWAQQREDRTQVVRLPPRAPRKGLSRASVVAFLVTVTMLGLGIYRAERAAGQGEAVAQGVR